MQDGRGTCDSCRAFTLNLVHLSKMMCISCYSLHTTTCHTPRLRVPQPPTVSMLTHKTPVSSTRCACGSRSQASRISVCRASTHEAQHINVAAQQSSSNEDVPYTSSRRGAIWTLASLVAVAMQQTSQAGAVGFTKELKKRKLTPEDYNENADVGLRTIELEEGRGSQPIKQGDTVLVHYDCVYRGLDVVSSRSARLLGGNRTIAEPYEFVAGEAVQGVPLRKISDSANGMFAGVGGPKPPAALSKAVLGMKKGGKRSVLVDVPELGFPKGLQEIPPGGTFELKVEVLDILKKA